MRTLTAALAAALMLCGCQPQTIPPGTVMIHETIVHSPWHPPTTTTPTTTTTDHH